MKKFLFTLVGFLAVLFFWNSDLKVEAYPRNMLDGYIFDAEYYAAQYPSVAAACGYDNKKMYNYYRNFGWQEGQFAYAPGSTMSVMDDNFDAAYYAIYNSDVVAAFGNTPLMLYNHYVLFGKKEGRRCHGPNGIVMPAVTRAEYPLAARVLDTVGWDLHSAYNWCVHTLKYYGHGKPDMPEEGSNGTKWFADFGFTNLKGNCFVFSATFYEMAKLLGYSPRQIDGKIPLRAGGYGPHSWDEIDINGITYVFDPECTYAVGIDAYQIWYGKPGTWRYSFPVLMHE